MNKFLIILFIFLSQMVMADSVFAADECPPNADPVYCKIAQGTGGKVFDGKSNKKWEDVLKERPHPVEPKPTHEYSAFSKDIGCSEWTDKRSHEICQSLSDNLEWGWTGHAIIAPGWKSTFATAKNTYCEQNITRKDLPILEEMCGQKSGDYTVCTVPMDSRFGAGVERLINIIHAQNKLTKEFKGSVYDPSTDYYLLKGGCE